jgi:APA family basic amino acid/polyamine antiporter
MKQPETNHIDHSGGELRRELSLLDSLMINMGIVIASAIFLVPASVAQAVETPWMMLAVWMVAGVLSLCGALAFAELGAMMPKAGGEFIYLTEAYHPFWGYLYGWTVFAVIWTASIAAVAVALATYLGYFVPLSPWMVKAIAIGVILFLSALNCYGLRLGATTQNVSTFLKLALLAVIIVLCFALGGEGVGDFNRWLPEAQGLTLASRFGVAIVAALWAYDGWISITTMGGEVKQPEKFLPRSIILSVVMVMVIYLLANAGYSLALPMVKIAHSERVAADAVSSVVGRWGGGLVSLAIIISCFAAVHGMILTGARVYYAMAEEGLFFRRLAILHPVYKTPVASLLVQGGWASLLTLTGTYDQLFTYVVFDSWLFYALGGAAVLVLRRRQPERPRPYRTWGYPYLPFIFVVLSGALLLNTLWSDPRDSLIGIGIALLGVPGYLVWSRGKKGI